jgi:hypothetical protein
VIASATSSASDRDADDRASRAAGDVTMAEHWERLVAVAMLGTDRRNPPEPPAAIADLVDDTLREPPAERMLAQVAASVAVRRAGVVPAPPVAPLAAPPEDRRPVLPVAAAQRWYDVVNRWPVLEDEWMLDVVEQGWRIGPELVTDVLLRHRGDAVRRARARLAIGPLAGWLIAQQPTLGDPSERRNVRVDAELVTQVPELPVPAELWELTEGTPDETGRALAAAIAVGDLAHRHRAVLVNLLARVDPNGLEAIRRRLVRVDASSPGGVLATALADLAGTRSTMLAELGRPPDQGGAAMVP